MEGGTVVITTRKRDRSLRLLQYVLQSLPENAITIIYVRPVVQNIKRRNGEDVPFSKATPSEVSAAIDADQHRTNEMCKFLKDFCQNHKVNAWVIPIQTTSKGKDIVEKIKELKARVVYMLGSSKKGLTWKIAKAWKTAAYVKKHAPASCSVRLISKFSRGEISGSGTTSDIVEIDTESCSASDITDSRTGSTNDISIRSLSIDSLSSIELDHQQVQPQEEIFSLEEWLNHNRGNLEFKGIVNLLLDIANELSTIKLSEDVSRQSVFVRGGSFFRYATVDGHRLEDTLVPSPDIFSFGMLIFELLSRRPYTSADLVDEFDAAFRKGNVRSVLDTNSGWPTDVAERLTSLGLRCVEGRVEGARFMEVVVPELREVWSELQDLETLMLYSSP